MGDKNEEIALIDHFPHASRLPYLVAATNLFFLVGQSIISFDIDMHINIDLLITTIRFDKTMKEYSIITGCIRLITPDQEGHVYPLLAVLLFCWSGLWPHIKLFLLHRAFTTPMTTEDRGRRLQFLGALVKFSLLDVFLVVLIVSTLQFTDIGGPNNYATGTLERVSSSSVCVCYALRPSVATSSPSTHSSNESSWPVESRVLPKRQCPL